MPMNRSVVFLLGAGASAPAGIPLASEFTEQFARDLESHGPDTAQLGVCLRAIIAAWGKHHVEPLDLERLYEILDYINGPQQVSALQLPHDFPKWSRVTDLLGWELKRYVQRRCLNLVPRRLEYLAPLLKFHTTAEPLSVLTLNYDTAVEQVCDVNAVPWTDGFGADGGELDFGRTQTALRLVKLHGSASWYWVGDEIRRIVGQTQASIGRRGGTARSMTHEAIMVYPTLAKPLWAWPFPRLILEARQLLASAAACVVCGYAFRDNHIRDLVVGMMRANHRLRLAIADPSAGSVLETVLRSAEGAIDERRFHSFDKAAGKIQNALTSQELDDLVEEWTRDTTGVARIAHAAPARARKPSGADVTLAVDTVASGIATVNDKVVFAVPATGELWSFAAESQRSSRLVDGLSNPRGLAYDSQTDKVYLVENRYRIARGELPLPELPRLGGAGRVWSFDLRTKALAPVTGLSLITSAGAVARKILSEGIDSETLFGELRGVLRWPMSVAVEVPGQSLLVTQARSLLRVGMDGGYTDNVVRIPLVFNLVGVALVDIYIMLIDGGVHPHGCGRLLCRSPGQEEATVIREGLRRVGAVAAIGLKGLFAFSHGGWWPDGMVELCHVANPAHSVHQWSQLNAPSQIALSPLGDSLFVATAEGIVRLSLAGVVAQDQL